MFAIDIVCNTLNLIVVIMEIGNNGILLRKAQKEVVKSGLSLTVFNMQA